MQPSHPSNPPRNQATSPLPPPVEIADKSAERALSALAHGAIAFGLFGIGFLVSLGIAGVIWLYARRSPEVRFHSEQAGCYQCSVLLINVVCVIVLIAGGVLSVFTAFQGGGGSVGGGTIIGLCLFAIWFFGTIIYGLVAAIFVLMGKRFKYPIIGDRFEKRVW
jgi:uncharacterized Tic20 family protein